MTNLPNMESSENKQDQTANINPHQQMISQRPIDNTGAQPTTETQNSTAQSQSN